MKKIYIIVAFISCLCLASCSSSQSAIERIDSITDFNLFVPDATSGEEAFFHCFFSSILTDNENIEITNEEGIVYTAGKDIFFSGEGTDELDGANVYLNVYSVKELIDEDPEYYYQTLAADYIACNDLIIEGMNSYEVPEACIDSVEKALSPYNEGKLLQFYMYFSGSVGQEIKVESMTIPELDFTFDFDQFTIHPVTVPEDVNLAQDGYPFWSSFESLQLATCPNNLHGGNVNIFSKALENIRTVDIRSLDDRFSTCYRETDKEYTDYWSEPDNIPADTDVDIVFDYTYIANEPYDVDTMDISVLMETTSEKGEKYWCLYCQPNFVEPRFLLYRALDDSIFEEFLN